ncbi:MAG: redoxin domain-containing protein, partial [bacterium]|nr:redoxin domain-containing protein [bacterium]
MIPRFIVLLAVGVVLFVSVAAVATASAQTEAYDQMLEKAEKLIQEQKYKGAIKAYKEAEKLAGRPTYECRYRLADAYIRFGDFRKGIKKVRESLPLAQDTWEELQAYNLLGLGLFAIGDRTSLEAGVEAFEMVMELSRRLPPEHQRGTNPSLYSLGVALLTLGRDEEGVAMLQDFLEARPTAPEAETARLLIEHPLRARFAPMPEFEAVTLEGEHLTSVDLQGNVVLLDFWATWCRPCVAAIPHLQRLSQRAESDPFVVVSISSESRADLRSFVGERGMTWPQVWDKNSRLTDEVFGVTGLPTHILVGHAVEVETAAGDPLLDQPHQPLRQLASGMADEDHGALAGVEALGELTQE